ncbi:protein RoBo-1-like [Thomomys bottae]
MEKVFGGVRGLVRKRDCYVQKLDEASHSCKAHSALWSSLASKRLGNPLAFIKQKGCSLSECVPLVFSATLGDQRTFWYNQQCCQTAECNRNAFPWFQKSSDTNGIECPACYTEKSNPCDAVSLKCTGAEKKCVEVTGTEILRNVSFVTFSAKGCATESACNLKDVTVMGGVKIRTSCSGTNDATLPVTSALSSVLAGIFLLKILL